MAARRGWRLDLAASAWLLAGLWVTVAVFSYDRADPPAGVVYSPRGQVHNFLGTPGAWFAHRLHETFGAAMHILLAGWCVLVGLLFERGRRMKWARRLAGTLLLVPVVGVLAERSPGLTARGGTLGSWLANVLEAQVPEDACPLLLSVALASALVLAIGELLVYPLRAAVWVTRAVLGLDLGGGTSISSLEMPAVAASALAPARPVRRPRAARTDTVESEAPTRKTILAYPSDSECSEGEASGPPSKVEEPEPVIIPIHHPEPAAEVVVAPPKLAAGTEPAKPRSFLQALTGMRRAPEPAAPVQRREQPAEEFELPAMSLLEEPQPFPYEEHEQQLRDKAALLEKTFADFNLNVRVVGINTGPVVTQFEISLETGLRVHKVTRLADDLALCLKVPSVRVVAPIPGKNTVGIEVPNEFRASVRLKEVILTSGPKLKAKIPLFLGKDTEGKPLVHDLAEMPHLLIAGRTGTGKSVCMNAIILSILMTRRPDEVKMIMIDPKMLELSEYGKIPHLMHPVVKDMKKAEAILAWAVDKMEERYDILSRARVRSIAGYNELAPEEIRRRLGFDELPDEERSRIPDRMPYIVIFVDEMNDLMMTMKKEVEGHIIRLAQKSRAAGIHLVVATQKPTVDVITGLIKSNLPARICFQVSSRTDSRVVLDEMGADKLLGKGDMLFLIPGTSTIVRAQGTYASDEEIARVVEHLECDPCYTQELVQIGATGEAGASVPGGLRARDELYESAIEVVVREGRGSVSLLQRALGIGYGRAARLVDFMAEDGIVGDYNGSQAREVLYTPEQWAALREQQTADTR